MSAGRNNSLGVAADWTKVRLQWNAETNEQLWLGHRDRPNEVTGASPGRASDYPGGHAEGILKMFEELDLAVHRVVERGRMPASCIPMFRYGHGAAAAAR